jgi:hypothetical protein
MLFSSKPRAFVNLVRLQEPDLVVKRAALQINPVSAKQRSMQPSREFAVTVLLSGGSKVESSHTVKL